MANGVMQAGGDTRATYVWAPWRHFQSRAKFNSANFLVAWLTLIGVILPFEISIYVGGAKFTPGSTRGKSSP